MSKTISRRGLLGAMAGSAAIVSGMPTACGPARQERSREAALKGPVTVTLWDREEASYQPFMDQWLRLFNSKHQKISVQYEARPPDWGAKLTATMVAGTPPDCVAVFGEWFRNYQEQKQLLVLDKYIKMSKFDEQDFVPGPFKGMNFKGEQIAIPQYINTNTMYYNREVFKRSGISEPKEDWTHDQFLDLARRLTKGPLPVREVWGFSIGWTSLTTRLASLLWGQGAQYTDPKAPDVFTWNIPQNVRAFQWVHDIPWRHRLGPLTSADRGGRGQSDAFFNDGTIAMMLEGTHLLAEWKAKAQVDWDVAPLPKGPAGRGGRMSMDGYIIPLGVKVPDASWLLIEGITDKEANKLRGEIVGFVPARKSQFDFWTRTIPNRTLKNALPPDEARPDPAALWPRPRDVNQALGPIWDKLFNKNELPVPDALKQAHEAVIGVLGPAGAKAG